MTGWPDAGSRRGSQHLEAGTMRHRGPLAVSGDDRLGGGGPRVPRGGPAARRTGRRAGPWLLILLASAAMHHATEAGQPDRPRRLFLEVLPRKLKERIREETRTNPQ